MRYSWTNQKHDIFIILHIWFLLKPYLESQKAILLPDVLNNIVLFEANYWMHHEFFAKMSNACNDQDIELRYSKKLKQ